MKSKLTALVTIALAGVLGACATTGDPSSPFVKPRVGSVIELNQEISARNGARIYLQDGYVLSWRELEKQMPYCQFFVNRPSSEMRQPLTVQPDSFTVRRVYRQRDFTALEGVQLAMNGGGSEAEVDRGSSQRTMSTYMELSSATQPDVTNLICSQWRDPRTRNHVSINEIIAALGDIARFIPPR